MSVAIGKPASGRTFSRESLAQKQVLNIDYSGAFSVSVAVEGCPAGIKIMPIVVPAMIPAPMQPTVKSALDDPDVHAAYVDEMWAWRDHGPCSRVLLCATYFDDFGLNLSFSDGSVVPFAHVQRLTTSAHDCIQNAKNALHSMDPNTKVPASDRALAVEWVMASQIHNKPLMNWMRNHPDAIVTALYFVK